MFIEINIGAGNFRTIFTLHQFFNVIVFIEIIFLKIYDSVFGCYEIKTVLNFVLYHVFYQINSGRKRFDFVGSFVTAIVFFVLNFKIFFSYQRFSHRLKFMPVRIINVIHESLHIFGLIYIQ